MYAIKLMPSEIQTFNLDYVVRVMPPPARRCVYVMCMPIFRMESMMTSFSRLNLMCLLMINFYGNGHGHEIECVLGSLHFDRKTTGLWFQVHISVACQSTIESFFCRLIYDKIQDHTVRTLVSLLDNLIGLRNIREKTTRENVCIYAFFCLAICSTLSGARKSM